jgi:thiamine-phosphate pyrophosphorylase
MSLVLPSPLYAILDVDIAAARGLAPLAIVEAWLSAGVRLIQLRAKSIPTGALLDLADQIAARCREAGARFIVNDRADVAVMAAADGVHVGQTDLAPRHVRAWLPPTSWIGYSTHTLEQMASAISEPVDYLAFGPVFSTSSKLEPDPVVGLGWLAEAARRASSAGLPLVAIGGITLERVGDVMAAGASAIAVISDLLSGDPGARAREYLRGLPGRQP